MRYYANHEVLFCLWSVTGLCIADFQSNDRISDVRNSNRKSLANRSPVGCGIVESRCHSEIRVAESLCLYRKAFVLMTLIRHWMEICDAPFNYREPRVAICRT